MRRRAFVGGLATAAAACAHADAPRAPGTEKLGAFFAALRDLQTGSRTTAVNVLQIGDSHTANDGFSGRMRELFQQNYGDAGRGVLPPGIPFTFYKPDDVVVTATGWEVRSSFRGAAGGPFGITGLRQRADLPAEMTLQARPGDLAFVALEFLAQPGGGVVQVSFDAGAALTVSTDAVPGQVMWRDVAAPLATRMTLRAGGGPVEMMSWRVGRAGPGVTWSNLGTIGATAALLERWDRSVVQAELARETPALIVLAFGSNEGFQDDLNLAAYEAQYRGAVALLRAGAPQASLLLLGPPDGVRRPHPGAGPLCPGTDWQTPQNLPRVRDVQRAVARDLGLVWWDWSAPMGGPCSMVGWAAQTPPLANEDHLHLRHAGYRLTAEALYAELFKT